MHIVFVTTELATKDFATGGLGTFTANMAEVFYFHGHEVEIIVATSRKTELSLGALPVHNIFVEKNEWDIFDEISKLYPSENAFSSIQNSRGFVDIKKAELVRDKINEINKTNKIDIIHFSNHGSLSLFMDGSIPYVIRISGFINICFQGANRIGGSLQFDENPLSFRDKLEILTLKKARSSCAPSKLVAGIANKSIGINTVAIDSPFVLDKTEWDYSCFEEQLADKRYVLFYGSLNVLKGIHVVAELIGELLEKHKDILFVLAGKDTECDFGDEKVFASEFVRKNAGKNKNRVVYLGKMSRNSLYPLIEHAEIVTLPSRMDNLPNTMIEAMSLGKIVVATNGASFDEVIRDGENGFLFTPDDACDCLSKIEYAMSLSDEEKKRVSNKAKETTTRFEVERIYGQWADYYTKVIASFS